MIHFELVSLLWCSNSSTYMPVDHTKVELTQFPRFGIFHRQYNKPRGRAAPAVRLVSDSVAQYFWVDDGSVRAIQKWLSYFVNFLFFFCFLLTFLAWNQAYHWHNGIGRSQDLHLVCMWWTQQELTLPTSPCRYYRYSIQPRVSVITDLTMHIL